MEDYDVFNEMYDFKIVIMGIDLNEEKFWEENVIKNQKLEFMPIRFSYELTDFSEKYIEKTKKLFIYYYDLNNSSINEAAKLKKHFRHYRRRPSIIFLPERLENEKLKKILLSLDLKVVSEKTELLEIIKRIV